MKTLREYIDIINANSSRPKVKLREGTWALPHTDEARRALQNLMSKPLKVGRDNAARAKQQLEKHQVGDDRLWDILANLSKENPEANIWDNEEVMDRLEELRVPIPGYLGRRDYDLWTELGAKIDSIRAGAETGADQSEHIKRDIGALHNKILSSGDPVAIKVYNWMVITVNKDIESQKEAAQEALELLKYDQ